MNDEPESRPAPPVPIQCVVIDPTLQALYAAVESLDLSTAKLVVIAVVPKPAA